MLLPHPPEKKAEARRFCETTGMTFEAISADIDVPASTIGGWCRREGWVRPPEAFRRTPISKGMRNALAMLCRAGADPDEMARLARCHPKTVRRIAGETHGGAAPPPAGLAPPPEDVAELHAALTGGHSRRDLLRLAEEALGIAIVQALTRRDPHVRVQDLARTIQSIKTLPDEAPAGASSHDQQSGPATFDEENALLDELTRRLGAFGLGGEADGPGEPEAWAARAVALYRRLAADALVAEVNQGGDMVAAVVRLVDPAVPVTAVVATRGKHARAEPVSALYRQGRVRHAGAYPALEDEMCDFSPTGLSGGRSPDRLDALVWALTHLMLERRAEPRVRAL
jgi:Terminase RNaseH-like domain